MAMTTDSRRQQWPFPFLAAVTLVGLSLLLQMPWAQAGLEHSCTSEDYRSSPRQGVCGTKLSNLIRSTCNMTSGNNSRRATVVQSEKSANGRREVSFLLSKLQALSFLQKRMSPLAAVGHGRKLRKRISSQNIVCECCINQCTFQEIVEYCS